MKAKFRVQSACLLLLLGAISCRQSPVALVSKGNQFAKDGKFAEAELEFKKAIRQQPENGEAHYRLGLLYSEQGNLREAYRNLSEAVRLLPQREDVATDLAEFCLKGYWNNPQRPGHLYEQLTKLTGKLLSFNPGSYEAARISGYLAILDRKPDAAIEHFRKALQAKPGDEDASAMLVQTLLRAGEKTEGEQLAKQYLASHKVAPSMYQALYGYYVASGRPDDALALLRQRVESSPRDLAARIALAEHHRSAKNVAAMNAVLSEVMAAPAEFPDGPMQVGLYRQRIGDLDLARADFAQGALRQPQKKLDYQKLILAVLLAQQKSDEARQLVADLRRGYPEDRSLRIYSARLDLISADPKLQKQALEEFRALVTPDSRDPSLHTDLGRAYLSQNDRKSAREAFRKAAQLDPGSVESRLSLYSLAMDRGDYADALRQTGEILAVQPDNLYAQVGQVAANRAQGRFGESRQGLNKLRAAYPGSSVVEVEAAYEQLMEGKPQLAEAAFRKIFRPGLENPRVVAGLVEALTAQRKDDEALKILESDLAKAPNRPIVVYAYAEVLSRKGRTKQAIDQYERLMTLEPESPVSYQRLAALWLAGGDTARALAVAEKGRAATSDSPPALAALAQSQVAARRFPDAVQTCRTWLAKEPDNPAVLNNLAFLLADSGQSLDEARTLAERATKLAPQQPNFTDTLGFTYLKSGRNNDALRVFQQLVTQQSGVPAFRYHYALALRASGDRAAARAQLEAASRQQPSAELAARIQTALKEQ